MRLADASFLVGLLVEEDSHHENAVRGLEETQTRGTGPVIVGEAVARETLQVLQRRYGTPQSESAAALHALCNTGAFRCDLAVLLALGEAAARPSLGFVDALLVEQSIREGVGLLSFDRRLLIHVNRRHNR